MRSRCRSYRSIRDRWLAQTAVPPEVRKDRHRANPLWSSAEFLAKILRQKLPRQKDWQGALASLIPMQLTADAGCKTVIGAPAPTHPEVRFERWPLWHQWASNWSFRMPWPDNFTGRRV